MNDRDRLFLGRRVLGAFDRLQSHIDSVASEAFSPPVTEGQRAELRARLAHHRTHPEEETVSLADIKAKLGLS